MPFLMSRSEGIYGQTDHHEKGEQPHLFDTSQGINKPVGTSDIYHKGLLWKSVLFVPLNKKCCSRSICITRRGLLQTYCPVESASFFGPFIF